MLERGTMLIETALSRLTHSTWKMYRTEHGTGEVVEAGVQVLVGHDDWDEIIKAIHFSLQEILKKDGGE